MSGSSDSRGNPACLISLLLDRTFMACGDTGSITLPDRKWAEGLLLCQMLVFACGRDRGASGSRAHSGTSGSSEILPEPPGSAQSHPGSGSQRWGGGSQEPSLCPELLQEPTTRD